MSRIDVNEMKAIVVLAIEHTLLKISKNTLEKVETELHQKYKCSISDCYEHPEYLSKVLKDLFGNSHHGIVRDVNKYLDEFTYQRPISEFLDKIK
ncbi:MAG: hypothetical protein KGI10_01560 [Thaumarchaeota archaeon]|nr:hypothetical protein [Nitrososphaerota archaeon]